MHPAAPRSSCACPHSLPFIIVPLDDPLLPSHHPGSNFHPFFQSNLSTFHSNLFGFRFFVHMHAPILVLHHHPGCHCPPNSTGTPPTHLLALCHPHQPPPSQIFMVSPVKTGTLSKIFRNFSTSLTFSALGLHPPHPHHPPNLPGLWPHLCTLPCTSALPFVHLRTPCAPFAHYCTPFCAHLCTFLCTFAHPRAPLRTFVLPLRTFRAHPRTLAHLCAPLCTFPCTFMHLRAPFAHLLRTFRAPMCTLRSIFRVCHPYLTFFLTLDPLPATMGNPALMQPGIVPTSGPLYNQVQPVRPPCCPSVFPVGLHNPHSCSRTRSSSHTTHPMAHGW